MQVPAPIKERIVPFNPLHVATSGSELVNMTGLPDGPPIALRVMAASPTFLSVKASNVMF